jgi:hypothetical protein
MVLPNFLVVGAARAGTTSLYYWLKSHPEVFVPDVKEPCFFVYGYKHNVSNWEEYLSLFEPGRGKIAIGDCSAAYLAAPESPAWIKEKLGNLKIIILLRNPVERAFSLYAWMIMEGYEWLPTFERALEEEEWRFSSQAFQNNNPEFFLDYLYFRSGLYYQQVKRYLDTFDPELIRIYLFEDLKNTPSQVYKDICQFLEISGDFQPDFLVYNASRFPRFIRLQYLLRWFCRSSERLPVPLGESVRRYLLALIALNVRLGYKGKLSSTLREKLRKAYQEDILKLSELIQRDLSGWL